MLEENFPFIHETDPLWGQKISFAPTDLTSQRLNHISEAFVATFIVFRFVGIMQNILQKDYYYSNQEEIVRIIELGQDMLLERSNDPWSTFKNNTLTSLLKE